MDWEDPLRNLPASTAHPAPESVASPELSSILEDSNCWNVNCCAMLKMLEDRYPPKGPEDDTLEILRTFVMKLPMDGQLILMSEIRLFKDDPAKLRQLRNFLVDAILKPMMVAGGKNPKTPITGALHTDAQDEILSSMSTIEASFERDQGLLKSDCLRRDGYRCVFTGRVDGTRRHKVPDYQGLLPRTQCAHILPFALRKFDDRCAQETQKKATIWWALYRYFPDLKDLIGPESINQHQNALTISVGLHPDFGDFNLALKPLGDNRYRTRWLRYIGDCLPDVITLASNDPSVPLPSSTYFWAHFRIAEILEVSGIGEKIAKALEKESCDPDTIDPSGSTDIGSILSRKMLMGI